jgi:plastocyanin
MKTPHRVLPFLITTIAVSFSAPVVVRAQTGAISGSILFEGTPPAPTRLTVSADENYCGAFLTGRDLVVREGKLAYAVVSVTGAEGKVSKKEYVLSNTACRFEPRVMAAAVGGTLVVENGDPLLHNANLTLNLSDASRSIGNIALPRAGMRIEKPRALRMPGLIDVKCDAHDWMSAKIWVFDHPHFDVTGEDGAFEISGLAPGTYSLTAWHEVLGTQQREVTIEPGGSVRVDVVFSPAQGE